MSSESIFDSEGRKFLNCPDIPLQRIPRVPNHHCHRDGLKSYVHALLKFNIVPTKDGPFFVDDQVQRSGKVGIGNFHVKLPVGEKKITPNVLMKKEVHRHRLGHKTSTSIGEVEASDVQYDAEYLCPVTIGSPGQTLLLDFDTGSADTWCWSTELPSQLIHHNNGHSIYDHEKSSTSELQEGYTWKVKYGDGSYAAGIVCNDDVALGGLKIDGQAVEMAKNISSAFDRNEADGIFGLAFGSLNTVKPHPVKTPVENMIEQQDIPEDAQLFTSWLSGYKEHFEFPEHSSSFYTFGFIDLLALKATGTTSATDIYYTPVNTDKGFWEFPSTTAAINGHKVDLNGNTAIVDTGTTLALLSDEVCETIYQHIPGAKYEPEVQGYVFPKHTSGRDLPIVQIDVGGKLFAVQREDLAFADAGHGMAYGGIQSRGSLPFDVLGDTFLKAVYAIFDVGKKQFGACQRVESHRTLHH